MKKWFKKIWQEWKECVKRDREFKKALREYLGIPD